MATAVVERFKQEVMYGLSAGPKSGRCGEVAFSGGLNVLPHSPLVSQIFAVILLKFCGKMPYSSSTDPSIKY